MTAVTASSQPRLPALYPASMLLEAIEDRAVRELLSEEDALRARRNALRAELRRVQEEKIQLQRTLQPLVDEHYNTTTAAMEALQKTKDALYGEMDELRRVQDVAAQARSELRGLTAELRELRSAVSAASLLLRDEQKEMDYIQRGRSGGGGGGGADAAKIAAEQKRVEKYQGLLRDRSRELQEKEAELQQRRAVLQPALEAAMNAEQSQRFLAVRQELDAIQGQLIAARRRRQDGRPDTSALRELDGRLDELHSELRGVEQRMQHIHGDLLPCVHFTYSPALRSELIGRAGMTLRQLQLDFGVALCLDAVPNGHGFIVGGAAAMTRCKAAIERIVQPHMNGDGNNNNNKNESEEELVIRTERVPFDVALTRQVVGPQGSQIAALERQSGARLSIRKEHIELTGSGAAIAKARALLEDFFASFATASMGFDVAALPVVLGRGGATIQRIQRESGVRALHVNRAQHTLTATGTAAAVARALAMYQELLGPTGASSATSKVSANSGSKEEGDISDKKKQTNARDEEDAGRKTAVSEFTRVVLHGDDHLVRRVIGAKGSKVKEIEAVSGARVSCEAGNTIALTGSASAVRAAQEMINQLRQSEATVKVEAEMVRFLHAAIVRDDMDEYDDDEDEDEEERKDEEGEEEEREEEDPLTSTPLSSKTPQASFSSSAVCEAQADHNKEDGEEDGEEDEEKTREDKRPHYQQRPRKPRFLSPLKAIQRVTRCDVMQWRAAESVVVLRGYQESVTRAETMLRQLLLLNHPHSELLPYPPVLRPLLLQQQQQQQQQQASAMRRRPSASSSVSPAATPHARQSPAEHHRMSPLEALRAAYSPLLQIDVDQARHVLRVSSQDAQEVREAVRELRTLVQTLTARHVRCLTKVPLHAIRSLIGPRGENIRGIEHDSETEVSVIRGSTTAEVQVLSRRGSTEDLAAALDMIRAQLNMNEEEGEGEEEKKEEGEASKAAVEGGKEGGETTMRRSEAAPPASATTA